MTPSVISHTRVRGTTTNSSFIATMVNSRRTHSENQGNGEHDDNDQGNSGGNHGGNANPAPVHLATTRGTPAATRRVGLGLLGMR
jgi:hypothetical protein